MPRGDLIQAGANRGRVLEGERPMPIVADIVDVVVGGDTHRDTHVLEMMTPTGGTVATATFANSDAGFTQALAWIADHAPRSTTTNVSTTTNISTTVVGLEGTRSYGIGLARALAAAGITVVEVEQPKHRDRRRRGKSDPIDAHLAALQVLQLDADRLPTPRADGDREALRILLSARQEMTTTRTRTINRLRALLLSGDNTDRDLARGHLSTARLTCIARRRASRGHLGEPREQVVRRTEARRLAQHITTLNRDLATNTRQLTEIITDLCPQLLDLPGVGPVSAAQAVVSWSHPGRCRSDAAFAALAGVCPIPASSGRTVRHRLNRGGDRALNRALHTIVLTRWRTCPTTHTYITRRRAQGRTDRDIRRSLKRYTARQLYRTLNTHTTTT
jgi:transposase